MTIPAQMNCPHLDEGWCLDCVWELEQERQELEAERDRWHRVVIEAGAGASIFIRFLVDYGDNFKPLVDEFHADLAARLDNKGDE